jgi:hypothetical protein
VGDAWLNLIIVFGGVQNVNSSGGNISVFREYIGFPVFTLLLGKSKWFSHFANHLKPNRSTDVCVLLLAVTTADPLAQLEKVAEKFDLPADASFFLKDLCGPTPWQQRVQPKRLAVLKPRTTTSAIVWNFPGQTYYDPEKRHQISPLVRPRMHPSPY